MAGMLAPCASGTNDSPIRRPESLPDTTPWNLAELSESPNFEWGKAGKVQSLFYNSEPCKGRTTRVSVCYATPGLISGDPTENTNLPGIVLVHGGVGKTFPDWVELWASRVFAALGIDLGGCGPRKDRSMSDGGPDQGYDMKFETIGLPVTEQWTYHAVVNVIRAHSLLLSLRKSQRPSHGAEVALPMRSSIILPEPCIVRLTGIENSTNPPETTSEHV